VLGGGGYLAAVLRTGLLPPDVTGWIAGSLLRRDRTGAAPGGPTELQPALAGAEGPRSADAA